MQSNHCAWGRGSGCASFSTCTLLHFIHRECLHQFYCWQSFGAFSPLLSSFQMDGHGVSETVKRRLRVIDALGDMWDAPLQHCWFTPIPQLSSVSLCQCLLSSMSLLLPYFICSHLPPWHKFISRQFDWDLLASLTLLLPCTSPPQFHISLIVQLSEPVIILVHTVVNTHWHTHWQCDTLNEK